MIPEQFGRVVVLLGAALAFPVLPLAVSYLFYRLRFRPERPDPIKEATYECGVIAEGGSWGQFNARYYLFALGFVIFDVEVIFIYPWAIRFNQLGLFALVEMFVFIAILALGWFYAWRKRAFEWR